MLTGKEALARIDAAIAKAEAEAKDVSGRLEALTRRQLVLREEERVSFAELAKFRVGLALQKNVAGALDGVERDVVSLLEEREAARQALEADAQSLEAALADLTDRRAEATEALENASEALDDAEAEVQAGLQADDAYQAQLAKVEAAEAVAAGAEVKRETAQEDRKDKGAPYEADPLFMYLWKRGYGTSEYRHRGLIRALDGWVARLIRYEGARRNYFMLLEIPKRLREHVDAMRAKADAELDALVAQEAAARDASEVPALEARHKARREALDAIDTDIGDVESRLGEVRDARARFAAGTDEHYERIVAVVQAGLEDDSLRRLKAEAYRTPEPEDEKIVERLQGIDDERDDIEDARRQLIDLQGTAEARINDIQELRREFRRKRYDDYTSEFEDDNLFGTLLREFIRGAVTGSDYWIRMDRTHKRRSRKSKPDFGSGRFRFPGPTTFPGSRRGGSSGGFGSGGGFRTGGGFGGRSSGGFRTGGGF